MSPNETPIALKARKLTELREEVDLIARQKDPDTRIWRQGLVHGRLLELQAFGVLTWQESDSFAMEMQLALNAQATAANDPGDTPTR